jgi:hypothetical protein
MGWVKFRNKVTKPFKEAAKWVEDSAKDLGRGIRESVKDVGNFVEDTWKDAGKLVNDYVLKPIKADPLGFIITAAAASFGIPFIVGPGAIASGLATTAVNLAQGRDFDDALRAGVTAGVLDFGVSEGINALSSAPKPFGSSLGATSKAPTFADIFSDASTPSTASAVDTASDNFNKQLSLDNGIGNDLMSAAPANDQFSSLLDPNRPIDFDPYKPIKNETYLTDDGMLGFDKGQYAAYTEPAPRLSDIYPEPKNYLSDISTNELGALPDQVPYPAPIVDMGTEAAKQASDGAYHWWEDPVGSVGKYSKDMIGVDVTNPWIVGGATLGLNYYSKKKQEEENERLLEEQRRNDPANSPTFTTPMQQYRMQRNRNRYTGDLTRYGERRDGNTGEFNFYDPAVYVPVSSDPTIQAATGGQIRAPYYTYGNAPQGYRAGGLSSLSDGRSDDIPAVLSDGEYVMDAETVALLGNGSTDAGAKQLDRMRTSLRKQKGKSLAKGKFSPNAKSPLAYLQRG